jgi:predicted  nucleic acid-binding Zn-ribbon protein
LEESGAEADALQRELATASEAWERDSAHLRAEAESLGAHIVSVQARRDRQAGEVTAGAVRLYEGLRKRKAGKAVVRVQGSSCSGCRVAIPDPVRRRIVNSPTLVQCPHCERILAPG